MGLLDHSHLDLLLLRLLRLCLQWALRHSTTPGGGLADGPFAAVIWVPEGTQKLTINGTSSLYNFEFAGTTSDQLTIDWPESG